MELNALLNDSHDTYWGGYAVNVLIKYLNSNKYNTNAKLLLFGQT